MSTNSPGPLNDTIIVALARLVDDVQARRDPSHDDIRQQVERVGLSDGDPHTQNQPVGKFKRVRAVLNWAIEHNDVAGRQFVANFLATLRGMGCFRETSPNFSRREPIDNAISAFKVEGFNLASTGELTSVLLDSLNGAALTSALAAYVM